MAHITLAKKTTSPPRLEFYSDDGGEPRRVTIEHVPFCIGRAETADLRVEAVEVSRAHAEIIERNGVWLVRDLGSTNGTQVNGRLIKEALLADGDILKIAESELTFVASAASQFQRMVTQPIHVKKSTSTSGALPPEVAAARMLTEATLRQAIPVQLLASRSLRHGHADAYFGPLTSAAGLGLVDQHHPAYDRYRELARMRAIELALESSEVNRLFLAVGTEEIDSPQRLVTVLTQLAELLTSDWELGITISLPIDVDILRIGEVYRQAQLRFVGGVRRVPGQRRTGDAPPVVATRLSHPRSQHDK